MTHGGSITDVSWTFAIGSSDREEWLSFHSEKTAVPSLHLPGERGKFVRGSYLSLARTVRHWGNTDYSRGADSSVSFQELTWLYPRGPLRRVWNFSFDRPKCGFLYRTFCNASRYFPERNWELSEALVADDSFSCLGTQTKRVSQKPNLPVNTHNGTGAWECQGSAGAPGGEFSPPPWLAFWQLCLPTPTVRFPGSSDPFALLLGRSPAHTDWQCCNWCFTYPCLFSVCIWSFW